MLFSCSHHSCRAPALLIYALCIGAILVQSARRLRYMVACCGQCCFEYKFFLSVGGERPKWSGNGQGVAKLL